MIYYLYLIYNFTTITLARLDETEVIFGSLPELENHGSLPMT